jgi:RimJ/RimL family protein N-acetyltransferase
LTVPALEALIAGDREALEAATAARFPEPLTPPPELADALPALRDALRDDPASGQWGPFLIVLRETGEAAGAAGFFAHPDAAGTLVLGYSVYPSLQRRGIASQTAVALTAWALAQPGIHRVQATIPPWHIASQRVAAQAGMRNTGRVANDPDEGPVEVWETSRESTVESRK